MKKINEAEDIFLNIYSASSKVKTELNYETDFQFLVAVILSAQATDKMVNIVTEVFFKNVKNPSDVLKYNLAELENFFSKLNYFRNKSLSIQKCARMLVDKYDSIIPSDINEIQKLPGVGIKTAKVVLGVLYDAPYIGVDTHVHRICNRIGICKTKSPEETDKYLEMNISIDTKRKVHHALVLFGRYTCTARNPKCKICPINSKCEYYKSL